jgi:hypothetical protein
MPRERVMIALDFAEPNFPNALCTLVQWAACAKEQKDFDVVFGVSTTMENPQDMINLVVKYLKPFKVFFWDNYFDGDVFNIVNNYPEAEGCRPYYPGFNYGSLVNKLLLLAHMADCQFLVRVDPGTYPFANYNFGAGIKSHIDFIRGTKSVVSCSYEGRPALRPMFVRNEKDHKNLVWHYTKINPDSQVTGGALWTSTVPGVPAIGFPKWGVGPKDLTLVWASDDAIYQVLPETKGSNRLPGSVLRFNPEGMLKDTVAYYRGVVGAVYLFNLIRSEQEFFAKTEVEKFLEALRNHHLDVAKYRPMDENVVATEKLIEEEFVIDTVTPERFLTCIRAGLENHSKLMEGDRWTKIADVLKNRLKAKFL